MKRTISLILSALLLLTMLAGCGKKAGGVIALTYVKSPLNVPSIVEREQGMIAGALADEGYETTYSVITSGSEQTAALLSGDIQLLTAVGGTSVLLAASNGADIKIINMFSRSPAAFMLFSRDEGITTPEDLRGKTVAGPKGTNLHELLAAYLRSGGMTLADVDYLPMDIPSAAAALEAGSVDCALQAGASAYNCLKGGYHLVTNGEGLIAASIVTAATGEFCREHPEIIDAFVAAQKQANDYIAQNHDAAVSATAAEVELTTDAVEEMLPMYDFSMEVTQTDIDSLKATARFLLDSGLMENEVDVESLFLNR